jgi:phage-related protein
MALSWTVEVLNAAVEKELDALPADMRARFAYIGELIAEFGLNRVGMPHVRHLTGPLWEMRLRGRDGISRALYVAVQDRRVVVVRVFVKKTQSTPRREIDLALRRVREELT